MHGKVVKAATMGLLLACAGHARTDDDASSGAGGASPVQCKLGSATTVSGVGGSAVQQCAHSWHSCSDGHEYAVACMPGAGALACECRVDGVVTASFQSTTFCGFSTSEAEEANEHCGFRLAP